MPWGVAAAAVAGYGQYAASKEGNKGRNTQEPQWLQDAQRFATDRATEIADRPYTPYTGTRVAGLSDSERQASQLARTGNDEARSYIDRAGQSVSELKRFDESDISGYMNPYTDAVLSPQLREQNRAYESERTRLLNSKAGAFGGDRVAIAESELGRRHMEQISDITSRTHSEAFDRATQLWSQDQDRQLRVADSLRAVGGDISRLNRQQIQDLMLTGGTERLLRQAELDFDFSQFIENRDWSVSNLDPLLKAIGAAKGGNVTTKDLGGSGAIGQALGAAATVLGAYYGGNSAGGGGSTGGTGAGGGVGQPVTGYGGSANTGYWDGGNSGVMVG